MELKSLSATSADLFEKCPSRWAAEYAGRANQVSSAAADKGTVVHTTLQRAVESGPIVALAEGDLYALFCDAYEEVFSDTAEHDDAWGMVKRWYERCDSKYWEGREVLATEVKKSFPIHFELPNGGQAWKPFNYIFDRVDRVNEEIEVVDYKTWRMPETPGALRHKIQTKAYALAAYLEYPEAKRIWVTYDQLRYDTASVTYKTEEIMEFAGYFSRLAQRILTHDGNEERLNADCKWCVRKLRCTALATNRDHGGTLGNLTDLATAAKLRERIAYRKAGIEALLTEVDDFIVNEMKTKDLTEFIDDGVQVELQLKSRRAVDGQRGADILGPELMRRYGKLNVGDVDKLLKGNELTDAQKVELKKAIQKNWSAEPTPKIHLLEG